MFDHCCLAFHDEALAKTLAVERLLLQLQLESADVLMTFIVGFLVLLVLKLQLLHSANRAGHLLP